MMQSNSAPDPRSNSFEATSHGMCNRIPSVVVAGAYLLVAVAFGVYVIPNFRAIFADKLPGESLPWPTRIVTFAGPVVLLPLAVLGAPLLVFTDSLRRARWLHGVLVVALAFALAFTTAALFWPLMRLMEEAA